MGLSIRDVTEADAAAIAAIYAHHVLTGTASYDLEPPPAAVPPRQDSARFVAPAGRSWSPSWTANVAGYAYVTQFRDREAYRFTAEDSIYVHPERVRARRRQALAPTIAGPLAA